MAPLARHRLLWLVLIALLATLGPAGAESPRATHRIKACGLSGTPTSVTIDVYADSAPAALLGTVLNAQVERIGALDCYQVDLKDPTVAAVLAYPAITANPDVGWTLRWSDDAANAVEVSEAPPIGWRECLEESYFYAALPIPERGITQQVIDRGGVSYLVQKWACDGDFGTPDAQVFRVYRYNASGTLQSVTRSETAPSP